MHSSLGSNSRAVFVALMTVALPAAAGAQGRLGHDRELGKLMLRNIQRDIQKLYFDPTFRGFDLAARFAQAEEKLKAAGSTGQVMAIVAQAVLEIGDSHTRFFPPERTVRAAEAKGLKPGDAILTINGYPANRGTADTLRYLFYSPRPQAALRVVVQSPGQAERHLGRRIYDSISDDVLVWHMPGFDLRDVVLTRAAALAGL
jgi:hypothetical protein